jgi:hopanoid biosynthesis associated radical SAM protein HpnH
VLVSPAFSYEAVDDSIFLTQGQIHERFQDILPGLKKVRFYNTPVYLEFLKGERTLDCTPWGNPTRTPLGWKQPCYLLTDGHCDSFHELMEETEWDRYGPGKDPRCANCKVHSGFEASATREMFRAGQLPKAVAWGLTV